MDNTCTSFTFPSNSMSQALVFSLETTQVHTEKLSNSSWLSKWQSWDSYPCCVSQRHVYVTKKCYFYRTWCFIKLSIFIWWSLSVFGRTTLVSPILWIKKWNHRLLIQSQKTHDWQSESASCTPWPCHHCGCHVGDSPSETRAEKPIFWIAPTPDFCWE